MDVHFQLWLDTTATFNWPSEHYSDNATSSTHSYDSRPEADIHLDDVFEPSVPRYCPQNAIDEKCNECFSQRLIIRNRDTASRSDDEEFDEGPFMKMLLKLLVNMPGQPYQVNLHLTSIISKLALLPHPNLHEYLLNPMIPTAKNTRTLFKILQDVAKRLTMEIPRLRNYKKVIENTRLQLMSEDPSYDERLVFYLCNIIYKHECECVIILKTK